MKDYQKHIWDQYHYDDKQMRSWCGEIVGRYKDPHNVEHDWTFRGANHAALSLKHHSTTQPCPKCARAIIKELEKTLEDQP